MSQELFERWHAGKYFDNDNYHPKSWVDKAMFSELDSESATLNKLLENHNPWEAYYRLNSWLHALNKFVTWYHGEVGSRRSDVETQEPMVKFLRWLGENSSLVAQIMAGICAEYYSVTASPSGILLTVSFRPSSQRHADAESAIQESENTSQPTGLHQTTIQPSELRITGAVDAGSTTGLRPLGFSPNDMRSNALNPNNSANIASQINRANQMNPNNSAYRLSRKRN